MKIEAEQASNLIRDAFIEGFCMGYMTRGQGNPTPSESEWNETEAKATVDQLKKGRDNYGKEANDTDTGTPTHHEAQPPQEVRTDQGGR